MRESGADSRGVTMRIAINASTNCALRESDEDKY